MKIDYRTRYQTIKDKGAELSLNISSYIDKKYFLAFRNSYYANFNTIPLEDYINIIKSDADTSYFPIISRTFEGIEPIEEGEEYHALGYKITRYLRQDDKYIWDNTSEELAEMMKEKVNMRSYLPLELSYLFNTHNENTLEDTLTRYIKAVFNTPLDEEEIKEEISRSFNKYTLIFNINFDSGYLLHQTYKKPSLDDDFKKILEAYINNSKLSIEHIVADTKQNLEELTISLKSENVKEELIGGYVSPFNSEPPQEIDSTFIIDAIAYLKSLINIDKGTIINECITFTDLFNAITQDSKYKGTQYINLTTTGESYLRLAITKLNIVISNNKVIKEREKQLQALESIYNNEKLLKEYANKYLFLVSGKIERDYNSNKVVEKADIDINPHFVSTGEPTLEIVKGFQASTSEVNNPEEIKKIEQYRKDYLLKDTLEAEINKLKEELREEQTTNGYNTPRAREIKTKIEELALQLNNLELDKRGKGEYAPFNYFVLDNRYRKVDNTALITYQTTPTDSVIIVNNHTRLFASNSTIASFNALTTSVLVFLLACMIRANDKTFTITNEEIEKFILKDNYERATLSDRANARNVSFINALDILSKTTIQTQYTPSKTAQRKGISGRKRGSGSLISYSNTYKDIEITFNKDIYSIAFEDFPIIPLSPRVYDLKPRAFITAYYLHNLYAFNKKTTFSISINNLIENNISYSGYKKNLKKNPERLFKPILEDFNEMQEKEIISSYNPTLKEYMFSRVKMNIEDLITLTMIMKPQKKKGK